MEEITFNCPSCRQVFKIGAENAGREAKCPRCGAPMVIPAPAPGAATGLCDLAPIQRYADEELRPPPPARYDEDGGRRTRSRERDADYEDSDRRRRTRRRYEDVDDDRFLLGRSPRQKWALVRVGLLIVFIATCVGAGAFALQALAMLMVTIASFGGPGSSTAAALTLMRLAVVLALLTDVAAIVGYGFVVCVPPRRGAQGLAVALLPVAAAHVLLAFVFHLLPMFEANGGSFFFGGGVGRQLLGQFVQLLGLAELLLLVLFLRATALSFRDYGLADGCLAGVILTACTAGYALVWPWILRAFQPTTFEGARAFMAFSWFLYWAGVLLAAATLVLTIILLRRTRDAIDV